jgi:hypothetical protein
VTVVAEAGIGKSRLLYEFETWAQSQLEAFCVFQGRANPQTQGQAYGLLREILAWRLQIGDDDSTESAKQKIEQGIAPLFRNSEGSDEEVERAQAHAHLLGHLIGLDFGDSKHIARTNDDIQQLRDRAFGVQRYRSNECPLSTDFSVHISELLSEWASQKHPGTSYPWETRYS